MANGFSLPLLDNETLHLIHVGRLERMGVQTAGDANMLVQRHPLCKLMVGGRSKGQSDHQYDQKKIRHRNDDTPCRAYVEQEAPKALHRLTPYWPLSYNRSSAGPFGLSSLLAHQAGVYG